MASEQNFTLRNNREKSDAFHQQGRADLVVHFPPGRLAAKVCESWSEPRAMVQQTKHWLALGPQLQGTLQSQALAEVHPLGRLFPLPVRPQPLKVMALRKPKWDKRNPHYV